MDLEGRHNPVALPGTLGAVLYADSAKPRVPEEEWVRLVRAVAREDAHALQALYGRTHRLVFTLAMRATCRRAAAEDITLEVFDELWRRAAGYSSADGTVLGWIMNLARGCTIAWLRAQQRNKQGDTKQDAALLPIDAPDYLDLIAAKEQGSELLAALRALAPEERAAIESAFFQERDAAPGRLRSALHNLGKALAEQMKKPWLDERSACEQAEMSCAHALQALSPEGGRKARAHLAACWRCRRETEALRPVLDSFVAWPIDVLRPPAPLRAGPGKPDAEPDWEDVAPGIACKILATDAERHMVSMLVRLAPGAEYPPHRHAGTEELHLLAGELWIDERKLHPGDYNRAEPGTADKRVWSEAGCTCVLVTSTRDALT